MTQKSTEFHSRLKHGQETTPKTPTRILILSTAYLPQVGGSELAIKNITDRLPEISFDLITSRPPAGGSKNIPEYEKMGDVNVYRVGNSLSLFSFLLPKNFLPIAVFFKARQLIRKNGPYDMIHAYQASQAAGGGWLLKWIYPSIPFIVTVQEGKVLNQQSLLTRLFRYFIFRKADSVTVISHYLAQYVKSQNSKISVNIIPNGVDLEKFTNYHLPISNENKEEKVIITVSRLVTKNGIEDLVDAMAIMVNGKSMENGNRKMENVKLVIVGDGPLRQKIQTQITKHKLQNNIELVGEVSYDETPKYLAQSDIFVRPSLSEGLGTAFLEAMASGLPIIGTPVGGIPDFLKPYNTNIQMDTNDTNGIGDENGLFVEVNNPIDLAEKILFLIKNPDIARKLGDNGRKLVEEKYDWDIIANKFAKIYGRL